MIRKSIVLTLMSLATLMPANAQFAQAPAFPGAEGYGRYTTGGRGGKVYHVTTLEDNIEQPSDGMLRYYIQKKKGPRIIVFDVAGTIELKGELKINKGSISILGQTAPGKGICLKNYTLTIGSADNVIIRFIRCRVGDIVDADAMSASHHDLDKYGLDGTHRRIIIDHCSMSWSTDEVGSFYGNRDFTLQWCILSESLRASANKNAVHGYGGIWGGERASFHHNLLADNDSRMPRFDHGYVSTLAGPLDCVNNVIYNWGGNSAYGGEQLPDKEPKKINLCYNYYKPGPATQEKVTTRIFNPTTFCKNCCKENGALCVPAQIYINGNFMEGSEEVTKDNTNIKAIKIDKKGDLTYEEWKAKCVAPEPFKSDEPRWNYPIISLDKDPQRLFDKIIDYAGCSLDRDVIDKRVTSTARKGSSGVEGSNGSEGGLIDSADDAGGWPTLKGGKPQTDSDGDGMPDKWEKAHGLNPNVDDSGSFTLDPKQFYTNLEVYANSLVEDIVKACRANCEETFEEYYPDLTEAKKNAKK